jgi:hypothetical protein
MAALYCMPLTLDRWLDLYLAERAIVPTQQPTAAGSPGFNLVTNEPTFVQSGHFRSSSASLMRCNNSNVFRKPGTGIHKEALSILCFRYSIVNSHPQYWPEAVSGGQCRQVVRILGSIVAANVSNSTMPTLLQGKSAMPLRRLAS